MATRYNEMNPVDGFYEWAGSEANRARKQVEQSGEQLYGIELEALRAYIDHADYPDFQGIAVDDRLQFNQDQVESIPGGEGIYDDTTLDKRPIGFTYGDLIDQWADELPLEGEGGDADLEIGYALEHGTPPMRTVDEAVEIGQKMVDYTVQSMPDGLAVIPKGFLPPEIAGTSETSPKSRYKGYVEAIFGHAVNKNGNTGSAQGTSTLNNVYNDWNETLTTAAFGNEDRPSMSATTLVYVPALADSAMVEGGEVEDKWGRHFLGWVEAIGDSDVIPDAVEERYGVPNVNPEEMNETADIAQWVMEQNPIFWGKYNVGNMDPVEAPRLHKMSHLNLDEDDKVYVIAKYDGPNEPTTDNERFFNDQELNGWVYFDGADGTSHREEVDLSWNKDQEAFYNGPGKQAYLFREGTIFPHARQRLFIPGTEIRPYPFSEDWNVAMGVMHNLFKNEDAIARDLQESYGLTVENEEAFEQEIAENLGDATMPDGTPVRRAIGETAAKYFDADSEASHEAREFMIDYANGDVQSQSEQDRQAWEENGMEGYYDRLRNRALTNSIDLEQWKAA